MQVIKRATCFAGTIVGFVLLVGCGGDEKSERFASEIAAGCIPLDGSLYKSEEPASKLGITSEGDVHLTLTFEGGDFMMRAGEFIAGGSYECVDEEYHIDFSRGGAWLIELYDDGGSLVTALPWWTVPAIFIEE